MTTSIFLRSYAGDLRWMPYSLRSIHKFVSGIDKIIICVPREDMEAFKILNLTAERIDAAQRTIGDGYLDQQISKLMADFYTGSSHILYWDSDVLATRPFSPSDLMIDGKPRGLMTPYSTLVNSDGTPATPWQPIVSKALGTHVQFEYMRCHPFLVPREALVGLREHIQWKHECTVADYIARQPARAFSEFNTIYAWAHQYKPELFSWWNTDEKGVPKPFVRQFWSWSGLTDEEREEMERILE